MVTFPNAKINLGLDVLRKRPDGYHDLQTVMMPVGWTDILEIIPGKEVDSLTVTGRHVDCPPEKNLVMKAVRALRETVDFPPVDIYLHKKIPDGAGLGGGSADAAFTLSTINSLFSLQLGSDKLAEIASGIGADCPFFIYNRPMLCEGTGTSMCPIDICLPQNAKIALVKPPVSVSTKEAYARVHPHIPATPLPVLLQEPVERWQAAVKNDFETSVFPKYPVISEIKNGMMEMGALYASMSGSGSAVFGIFVNDNISEQLSDRFCGCDIFVSNLM